MIERVILCDRAGNLSEAILERDRWTCPGDVGDLGDSSGYRAVRVGVKCAKGRWVVEIEGSP